MVSRFSPLFVAAALLLTSFPALASKEYPDVIARDLATRVTPSCTVCHASTAGGAGTIVKPFGSYLQQRGLTGDNDESLRTALRAMVAERHDTDKDGITDEQELKDGSDPNGATSSDVPEIAYGCGRVAPARAAGSSAVVGLLIAAALSGARRRRRP